MYWVWRLWSSPRDHGQRNARRKWSLEYAGYPRRSNRYGSSARAGKRDKTVGARQACYGLCRIATVQWRENVPRRGPQDS